MKNDTLVVMGNGPSLAKIDLKLLNNFDTFALNVSYRAFEKFDWWPTYHGCFDYVMNDSHRESFTSLIESDNPIRRFFYLRDFSDSPRFQKIELLPFRSSNKWNTSEEDFSSFNDGGNSGINACQVGICLGYKKIILVGVDCNYVEHVEGTSVLSGAKLKVTSQIKNNPNYWFDEYQQVGDVFNAPQEKQFHFIPWNEFAAKAHKNNIQIINCSEGSKLKCFKMSTIQEEIEKLS